MKLDKIQQEKIMDEIDYLSVFEQKEERLPECICAYMRRGV